MGKGLSQEVRRLYLRVRGATPADFLESRRLGRAPPLRILHYRGKRHNAAGQPGTYKELFSVTLENKDGEWVVTKYDAMY